MDGYYFEDPIINKEYKEYMLERNKQLYKMLEVSKGFKKREIGELFGLTENSIKTMWKNHRHKYPEIYYQYNLTKGIKKL